MFIKTSITVFNGSKDPTQCYSWIALSAESVSYFQKQIDYAKLHEEQRELSLAKQFTLSVIWTLYWRNHKPLFFASDGSIAC
ncbi:MAG: hypothetical protein IPJ07_10840 [Acidobacteria bacterium]|nr:hypothetical protein [Acidobacteriota bacterium]